MEKEITHKKALEKSRLWLFRVIAILIPFALILVIELLLRLFNYGHNTDLFIKYPDDPSKWVMNKYASEKFFSDTVNATKGNIEPFNIYKTPGTLRIFVLGESTTAGYPYFHNGSFHRWLLYRLMHNFPQKKIELINLSLTAVNSYTVLDFSRKIIKFQPDAVLIYVGHNEYYGALGIGSTSYIGGNYYVVQAILKLRALRFVQFIDNFLYQLKTSISGQQTNDRENLMKRMAAKQQITYHQEDYNKGIKQFGDNMDKVCKIFTDQYIPVFLSTIVSNEKDLKPLISADGNSKNSADKAFKEADAAFSVGNYPLAKNKYIQAKEYDLLRFRAPAAMNQIIKKLTVTYPDIHLVDAYHLFEQNSIHGILGKETLLEHVHPNLYGYALLSEAFYQAMIKTGFIKPAPINKMSFARLLTMMPVTKVDSLCGAYQVIMLKAGWPFNEPIKADFKRGNTIEEQLAGPLSVGRITWQQAMDALFKQSMQTYDKKTALKATEAVLLENPDNILYYIYSGRLSFETGNQAEAEFYFKKAFQLDDSFANAQNLYLLFIKSDRPEEALAYLNIAMEKNRVAINLQVHKDAVLNLIQLKHQLQKKPDDPNTKLKIAAAYQSLNENELSVKYAQKY